MSQMAIPSSTIDPRCSVLSIPSEGSIVLTCPIREAKDYFIHCITHLKVPSIYFIVRLVKTCVMSIFRWHMYDIDNVLVVTKTGQYIHSLDGSLKSSDALTEFRRDYPCMLEHAVVFLPQKVKISSDEEENKVEKLITEDKIDFSTFKSNFPSLSLSYVVNYYRDVLRIEGFPKQAESKGAFTDLWNNTNFTRTSFKID